MAASNGSEFFEYEIEAGHESFVRPSNADAVEEDESELLWAALERLPSQKRGNFALLRRSPSEFHGGGGGVVKGTETIDVTKLGRVDRQLVVKKALATNDQDNYKLLSAVKGRLDRVGLEVPKVEVRYENLSVKADVQTGSRALPTLLNVTRDVLEQLLTSLRIFRPKRHSLTILNDVSGYMNDLPRLEKEKNIHPSPEIDAFMKASSVRELIKPWWVWAFWVSPLSYGQRAISVNEFTATRWMKKDTIGNGTLGYNILLSHNLSIDENWYYIGVGVLLLYACLFNIIMTVAISYLNPLKKGQTVMTADTTEEISSEMNAKSQETSKTKGMILPFQPLTMTFHNVNYFVDMPKEMTAQGIPEKRLQLLGVEASIENSSIPPDGSQPLHFSSTFAQDASTQFRTCFWKQNLVYWRSPQYNAMRILFTTMSALIIGSAFWDTGSKRDSTQALTGLVELPYIAAQTIIYGTITYFMIHFERTVGM
ncbi:hypothetical protein ACFE04_012711 [Oxalis oulophora]